MTTNYLCMIYECIIILSFEFLVFTHVFLCRTVAFLRAIWGGRESFLGGG